MGKQAGPSPEELEFIFGSFVRGLSDKEILDEMQDKEFPLRNPRFMRERRREFEAAKKVVKAKLEIEIDPLMIKRKEQHFDYLATIAKTLLANGIDNVQDYRINKRRQETGLVFIIVDGDSSLDISQDDLSSRLMENVKMARSQYGDYDFELLIYHLLADHGEIAESGLESVVIDNPYELIETLRMISRRKMLNGYCDVCEKWR